jgi:hypothetical protein
MSEGVWNMVHKPSRPRHLWINFNIVLFSGYALLGIPSFFWPSPLRENWVILLHILTLVIEAAIVYGLIRRVVGTNYLVAVTAPIMISHLLIFTFVPLGIQFAFMGPSRAFYTFFIKGMSKIGGGGFLFYSLTAFNMLLMLIHGINLCYFTRRKVSGIFVESPC